METWRGTKLCEKGYKSTRTDHTISSHATAILLWRTTWTDYSTTVMTGGMWSAWQQLCFCAASLWTNGLWSSHSCHFLWLSGWGLFGADPCFRSAWLRLHLHLLAGLSLVRTVSRILSSCNWLVFAFTNKFMKFCWPPFSFSCAFFSS